MAYSAVKIMADFNSSGIWDFKTGIMIDYEELEISVSLKREFEKWINYYDGCFEMDYATFKPDKTKRLNKVGKKLARKLKKELGISVYYLYEDEDGLHQPEEIIIDEFDT